MTEKKTKRTRVQFDFAQEALGRLDEIKRLTGAATRAEALRNCLYSQDWLIEKALAGETVKLTPSDLRLVARLPLANVPNSPSNESLNTASESA